MDDQPVVNPAEVIEQSVRAIYFIAVTQVIVSMMTFRLLGAADGVLFGGLAFWLRRKGSILAAALLVVLAVVGTGLTAIQLLQGRSFGGIIFAGILLWASVRAVRAAARLPRDVAR